MASAEDSLIATYFRPLATDAGAFGLIDDAALLKSTSDDLVVTTDAIVEGVHYLPDDPPDTIARKALRVNLSDLAAKGATPAGFVLTLALREIDHAWLASFSRALGEDSISFGCPLLGGDTVSTPGPTMISITAFGRVPPGKMVRRDGAQVGDHVVVTGTIGDAALGLMLLREHNPAVAYIESLGMRETFVSRYRVPQPRVALVPVLRDYASAAMDVSDGLVGDLAKLCQASGVSAEVSATAIPVSGVITILLDQWYGILEQAISGGDDYEILCTVPAECYDSFVRDAKAVNVRVTAIGLIVAGTHPPVVLDATGKEMVLKRLSYSHF